MTVWDHSGAVSIAVCSAADRDASRDIDHAGTACDRDNRRKEAQVSAPAATPPRARLSHLGFYVRNLDDQAAFYKRVFNLVETDRGVSGAGDPIVFLTGDSSEHHQLVLTAGLPDDAKRTWLNQVSFRVGSLEELQGFHRWLLQCGVTPSATVSHGNAWSIYFLDPEGNNVEVYASSPWYVPQPFREVIDLTRPAEELLSETFESVKDNGEFSPAEDWARRLDTKLDATLSAASAQK